ncbi:MAG TPA: hypothetical protein VG676_14235 [Chitinophagaceae bacterium]|jgi:hypothetical protein|nr:hypothetical protein [Chitinophagaceae bacterium]
MNEKLRSLGRKLGKEEQKKIKGGFDDPGLCTNGTCGENGNCDSIGHGCTCRKVEGTTDTYVCATGR